MNVGVARTLEPPRDSFSHQYIPVGYRAGMFKNQLQELAQRSGDNLPSYACIREGPDHAPRFKATVTFNGEAFESPDFRSTLRQAEHAAAEVALNTLSERGQSLAARILGDTGACKNLLQEMAQRACVTLPSYTTIRSGPGHLPMFESTVKIAGKCFQGEPAKTKKQAEKNAATVAYVSLKQLANQGSSPEAPESDPNEEQEQTVMLLSERRGDKGHMESGSHLPHEKQQAIILRYQPILARSTTSKVRIIPLSESSGQTCTDIPEPYDSSCQISVDMKSNPCAGQKHTLGHEKGNIFMETGSSHRCIIPHQPHLSGGIVGDGSGFPRKSNSIRTVAAHRSGNSVSPMPVQWSGTERHTAIVSDPKDEEELFQGEASTIFIRSGNYFYSKDGVVSMVQVPCNPTPWTRVNQHLNVEAQGRVQNGKAFRAATSLAPAVTVRQMVPVFSAPPHPSESEDQERRSKGEVGIRNAFGQLRL